MKNYFELILFFTISLLSFSTTDSAHKYHHHSFLQCLLHNLTNNNSNSIAKLIHTPNDPSYLPILNSIVMNPRVIVSPNSSLKPLVIVTPSHVSQVQSAVLCAKKHGIRIRTRSGGHDSKGLSYSSLSHVTFLVIDIRELRSVEVDDEAKTAWAQAEVTLGELYYCIAEKSAMLGFPAGICCTVSIGRHFSGGGYGLLLCKYGLASDNVVNALLVDVNGRILDRKSMGEDLFWAIRGGGAASFGVVLAWKVWLPKLWDVLNCLELNTRIEYTAQWEDILDKMNVVYTVYQEERSNDETELPSQDNIIYTSSMKCSLQVINTTREHPTRNRPTELRATQSSGPNNELHRFMHSETTTNFAIGMTVLDWWRDN